MRGSFVVGVFGTIPGARDGKEQLFGQEIILSHWHTDGCSNRQLHTGVRRYIPLHGVTHEHVDQGLDAWVEVFTKGGGVN